MEAPATSSITSTPYPPLASPGTSGASEISQLLGNEWVPQDNDRDQAFDFLDPVMKGQWENHPGERHPCEERKSTNGFVEGRPKTSPQKSPKKLTVFTRPMSSHDTPGFSFTKPKPLQPLNFGQKSNKHSSVALPSIAKTATPSSSSGLIAHVSLSEKGKDTTTGTSGHEAQSVNEVDGEVANKPSNIPFPLVLESIATKASRQNAHPEASTPLRVCPQSKDQQYMQPGKQGSSNSGEEIINSKSSRDYGASDSHSQRGEEIRNRDQESPSTNPHDRLSIYDKKIGVEKTQRPNTKMHSWLKGQDDVIHMLMFNHQKHSQEFQRMVTIQKEQKEEIAELLTVKDDLAKELQDAYKQLEERDIENKGKEDLKTKVQARLRKFVDFLNNLSENHSQLRDTGDRIADEAQKLRMEQMQSQVNLQETREAMNEKQAAISRQRTLWTKELLQDEAKTRLLEQQVQNLQEKLQREQAVSHHEQFSRHQLEENINHVANGFGQSMSALNDSHKEISKNIQQILDKSIAHSNLSSAFIAPTQMLEKCVGILEALRERGTLQATDLDRLKNMGTEDTDIIMSSFQACQSAVLQRMDMSQQMAQQGNDFLNGELRRLSGIVIAEQPHQEKIAELREAKAILEVQLQAAEKAMQDARVESAVLRTREEKNSQRIAILGDQMSQLEAATTREAIALATDSQLHDLEAQNEDLVRQSATLETEVARLSDQLQQKNHEIEDVNGHFHSLEANLKDALEDRDHYQVEFINLQIDLDMQRRQIIEELNLKEIILNMETLRRELAEIDKKLAEVRSEANVSSLQSLEEINSQIAKNAKLEKELVEEKSRLRSMDAELHKERNSKLLLQEKVSSLGHDVREGLIKQNEKDKEIINLKTMLKQPRTHVQNTTERLGVRHEKFGILDEDGSQIEEIPRDEEDFAKDLRKSHKEARFTQPQTPLPGENSISEETMRKLLVSSPEELHNSTKVTEGVAPGGQLAVFQRSKGVLAVVQVEDSQSADSSKSSSMTYNSLSIAQTSDVARELDEVTAQNTAVNAHGPKSNTKIARKRNVTAADLAGPDEPRGVKKATRSSSRVNGSIVIADSQPLEHAPAQTNRPARLSTTQKKGSRAGSRAGLYQKEFERHLRP